MQNKAIKKTQKKTCINHTENKIGDINLKILIITLHVNVLSNLIKRQKLSGLIQKKKPATIQIQRYDKVEIKRMEKVIPYNSQLLENWNGYTNILKNRLKTIAKEKDEYFIMVIINSQSIRTI